MSMPCIIRVLVVDNDAGTRNQVVRILRRAGCLAQAAEGQGVELGDNAKRLALAFRPHVVIMDLRLADEHADDRSGLDLWKDPSFSSARCILYSAYLNRDYRISVEALTQEGVGAVIGKEDDPQKLVDAVKRVTRDNCGCKHALGVLWPQGWNEQAVLNCLYKERSDLPADLVEDVLGRLFPKTQSLVLKELEGTTKSSAAVGRGRAVLLQAWPDDQEPVVVKLAPKEKIQIEADAYAKHIDGRLMGQFSAQLQKRSEFWALGGLCYSFMGSSENSLQTFANFYRESENSAAIVRPLEHFWEGVWKRHYTATHPSLSVSIFDAYEPSLKLRKWLKAFPQREERLRIAGVPSELPNPASWIQAHAAESYFPSAVQAVTHGDLHGDNLFVERDHAWAIDFERTGMGHILRDFVELEEDIITRLVALPQKELSLFHELAVILTQPTSLTEAIETPTRFEENQEVRKAVEVIRGLRSIAHSVTHYTDMREYYWGLLLDAFFSLKLAEQGSEKWWRGLVLASLLCARLENC